MVGEEYNIRGGKHFFQGEMQSWTLYLVVGKIFKNQNIRALPARHSQSLGLHTVTCLRAISSQEQVRKSQVNSSSQVNIESPLVKIRPSQDKVVASKLKINSSRVKNEFFQVKIKSSRVIISSHINIESSQVKIDSCWVNIELSQIKNEFSQIKNESSSVKIKSS